MEFLQQLYFENSKNNLSIYPNPVIDKINFSFADDNQDTSFDLAIYDLSGRVILSKKAQFVSGNYMLPIENIGLNTGIYLVKLKNNSQDISKKIVIK